MEVSLVLLNRDVPSIEVSQRRGSKNALQPQYSLHYIHFTPGYL